MIFLSYVGSFPLRRSYANIMQCTEDVLLIPVDYPNYIQLVDMIDQYLAPMANSGMGLSLESGKYFMKGDTIKFPEAFDNESLRILVELRNKEPYRNNIKGIKACVTGPFTLSSRILLRTRNPGIFGETALSNPSIVESLSNIVAKFAKYYQDLGADCIMIEEPILSVIVGKKILLNQYKNNDLINILDNTLNMVNCLKGIHVCGRISRTLSEILLSTNIRILDHEFKDSNDNFNIYSKKDIESSAKKINLGVVSSKTLRVESIEEIIAVIRKGIDVFGKENIFMIKPDCGFRGLDPDGDFEGVAYRATIDKIRNIRSALDSFQK
ncbi:MAG TPA: hypothetical protein VIH27_01345 [Nitrososphaerales archaeon]